jgi:hypothetical protein
VANYLTFALFFGDRDLPRTATFSADDAVDLFDFDPCLKASSRKSYATDCIGSLLAASGAGQSRLAVFTVRPDGITASVLPHEDLPGIAESIDDLLTWCATAVPIVSQLSEFNPVEEVEEELRSPPPVSSRPNTVEGVDTDGYGIRFIFCLLKTIAAVSREAYASGRSLIYFRAF